MKNINKGKGKREWGIGVIIRKTILLPRYVIEVRVPPPPASKYQLHSPFPIPHSLFFIFLFSFFIWSCNLFNAPKDNDYWDKIDAEIAWANAPKLEITFHAPEGWISSSSPSLSLTAIPRNVLDIRRGASKAFEFTLECEPSSSVGFEQWLVFETDFYNTEVYSRITEYREKSAAEMEKFCQIIAGTVTLVSSNVSLANIIGTFTIDTETPLTIVPWCSARPRVIQSNPPLVNSGMTFPRGQEIRITFSQDLDYTNNTVVPFGEGYIQINGMNVNDSELLNGHGDLTGLTDPLIKYFADPVYQDGVITIAPIPENLPPANLIITVTAGVNIMGKNGKGLAAPVSFFYTTDDRQIVRAYYANNIYALHPGHDPETQFFYQMADRARDRRIRINPATEDYEVTMYFNVTSSSDDMAALPDTIDIVELEYASLAGNELYDSYGRETAGRGMKITDPSVHFMEETGAGAFYRNANPATNPLQTGYYEVTYSWGKTPPSPGIHRLAALPYRTGTNPVERAALSTAISRSQYVTVVYENQPPGGAVALAHDAGAASVSSGVYNYNNSPNNTLTIQADFSGITDNHETGGIRQYAAAMDRPWTMDEASALQWQYRIVTGATQNYPANNDTWYPLAENNKPLDITSLSSSTVTRSIELRYRDSLGNESQWVTARDIRYYNSARGIRALHNPATATADDFLYQGAPLNLDRRLRGTSPDYSLTIYFYMPANTTVPDKLEIAEINYAALQGNDINELVQQKEIVLLQAETTGADGLYIDGIGAPVGASYYKAEYIWNNGAFSENPGIIRLAVMPYNNADSFVDTWQAAVAEGRFVTVVLDNLAPGGNHNFSLSGEEKRDGTVYLYNTAHRDLTIGANFSGIIDNAGLGIPRAGATQDKPWTMEEQNTLQWQYRIARDSTADFTSTWAALSTSQRTQTLSLSSLTTDRNIEVKYRDSLGNESGWLTTGLQIRYYTGIEPPSGCSAVCNAAGNSVTVSWTRPSTMTGVEVLVDGVFKQRITAASGSYSFAVGEYDTTGIRRGEMNKATAYSISLMAYSNNGDAAPVELKIWNIPGMSVNQNNTVVLDSATHNQSQFRTALNSPAAGVTNFVLTSDFVLNSAWNPVNLDNRNFYGNGHTITINSFLSSITSGNVGLFSNVGGNAVIRDLRVHYNDNRFPDNTYATEATRFGGIVGIANGNAELINVQVTGKVNVYLGNYTNYAGGIVGFLGRFNTSESSTASIKNSYSALDITVIKTGLNTNQSLYVGGITGSMGGAAAQSIGPGDPVRVEKVSVVGNITVGSTYTGVSVFGLNIGSPEDSRGFGVGGLTGLIYGSGSGTDRAVLESSDYRQGIITVYNREGQARIGGAVGLVFGNAYIADCTAALQSGFNITKTDKGALFYVGGFAGHVRTSELTRCFSEGPVMVDAADDDEIPANVDIGGFVGRIDADISYCYAKGNVSALSYSIVNAGGFAGRISYTNRIISNCFSIGNVSVVNRANGFPKNLGDELNSTVENPVFAGGFVGRNSSQGTVSNSYATGDVFVDKPAGTGIIFAGGFAGTSVSTLERTFAAGNIIVQRFVSGDIYAGGLAGLIFQARTRQHNAVLPLNPNTGISITATGPSPGAKYIGRIYGSATNPIVTPVSSGIISNNHAFTEMQMRTNTIYGAINQGMTTVTATSNHAGLHGANAHLGTFRSRAFWQNVVPPSNGVPTADTGLEFNSADWDFSTVESRGYPILRGLEGQ